MSDFKFNDLNSNNCSDGKVSLMFVLNVLRQHEIDLDKAVAELNVLKDKIEKVVSMIQPILEQNCSNELKS